MDSRELLFKAMEFKERHKQLQRDNILLTRQLQASSDRNDFLEDCIAEMAMKLYSDE